MNSPNQGAFLVGVEIDPLLLHQRKKNPTKIVRLAINFFFGFLCVDYGPPDVRMVGNASNFASDCVGRQNQIDKAGAYCAARHRVELCALFSLREGQTACRLDCTQTSGAVAASASWKSCLLFVPAPRLRFVMDLV